MDQDGRIQNIRRPGFGTADTRRRMVEMSLPVTLQRHMEFHASGFF